jgi:hypothetical protein
LELNDLRTPDFKSTYTTDEGVFDNTDEFVVNTYKGITSDGKRVRFGFDENGFLGIIFGENYHYVIRSANDFSRNKEDKSLIVYRSLDIIPDDNYSDYVSDALEVPKEGVESLIADTPLTRSASRSIKVAIDADYEFYQVYGTGTEDRITMYIMNVVNGFYEANLGLGVFVTLRHIYTTSSQPYTSSDAETLLGSFRNYWNANLRGVNRNIAHLFTGKTLTYQNKPVAGIAYKGHINGNAPNNHAYSLTMEQSYIYNTTAHEIGHNLNAEDNPSDDMYCAWDDINRSSIMCQYSRDIWFSAQSKNEINTFLSNNSYNSYGLTYISGPAEIYYNGNKAIYYLYNAPSGTVTWTISGPFSLSTTTGSATTVTVTANSGSGTLTAKVNGKVVVTQSITASSPSLGPVAGPDAVYKGSTYVSFQLMPHTYPGLKYEWSAGSLVSASSNTASSEGLFNVPNDPYLNYDMVSCTVSVNGNYIGTYSKSVYVY